MDANYMFLCGVMWCQFGQQDAAKELLRAAGCELRKSGYERTGLGDVEERCASLERSEKTRANRFRTQMLGAEARI